jgi:hypothetical protein
MNQSILCLYSTGPADVQFLYGIRNMCVSVRTKASEAQADASSMMVEEDGEKNVGIFLTIWYSLQLPFFFFVDSKRNA